MAYISARELQNLRNQRLAEERQAAHQRFMEGRTHFIESNPGAVSRQERAAVTNWQHQQGLTGRETALQAHELAMLQEKNAGELAIQQEKTVGMREQGKAAAEANNRAVWDLQIARDNNQSALEKTKLELESQERQQSAGLLTQKELAMAGQEAEREKNRAQFGYFDEKGNYVAGSQVNAEGERGDASVKVAKETGTAQVAVAKEAGAAQVAAAKEAARQRAEVANAKTRQDIVNKILAGKYQGMSLQQWNRMTEEERQAWLNEQVQN